MRFLSANILVFPRKATSSISRADINLAHPNWAENRPFSFDSHVAFVKHRNVVIQLTYYITFPCPKKHNYRKIRLIQFFHGKQKQSILQRWVRRSVKRMVILTMCHISEFQNILDYNYTRIGLSIYVKFSLGKWLSTRQKNYSNRTKTLKITLVWLVVECVTKHYHGIYNFLNAFNSKYPNYLSMKQQKNMFTLAQLWYLDCQTTFLYCHFFNGIPLSLQDYYLEAQDKTNSRQFYYIFA